MRPDRVLYEVTFGEICLIFVIPPFSVSIFCFLASMYIPMSKIVCCMVLFYKILKFRIRLVEILLKSKFNVQTCENKLSALINLLLGTFAL